MEFPKCEPFNWNFLNFQEKNQWNRNPCNLDCLSSKSLLLGHFLKLGPELLVKRSAPLFYCFSFCREGRILSHSRPQCQFCSFDMRQEWWPWLTTRDRFHYGRSTSQRDQVEYLRNMERYFPIKPGQPIGMGSYHILFLFAIQYKWREVPQWTSLSKWNGKFRSWKRSPGEYMEKVLARTENSSLLWKTGLEFSALANELK